jgi:hypothetical protein
MSEVLPHSRETSRALDGNAWQFSIADDDLVTEVAHVEAVEIAESNNLRLNQVGSSRPIELKSPFSTVTEIS